MQSSERERRKIVDLYGALDIVEDAEWTELARTAQESAGADACCIAFLGETETNYVTVSGIERKSLAKNCGIFRHLIAKDTPIRLKNWRDIATTACLPVPGRASKVSALAPFSAIMLLPIRAPEGHALGCLMVCRRTSDAFTQKEEQALVSLTLFARGFVKSRRNLTVLAGAHAQAQENVAFFDHALELFVVTDEKLHLSRLNPSWSRVLGWPEKELKTGLFDELIHLEDKSKATQIIENVCSHPGHVVDFELRHRHKRGHWVHLAWWAMARGGLIYGGARDVSAQRNAERTSDVQERQLRAALSRIEVLFNGMEEAAVLQDNEGRLLASNPAAKTLLQLSEDMLMTLPPPGSSWRFLNEALEPMDAQELPFMRAVSTGQSQRQVLLAIENAAGFKLWVSASSHPILEAGVVTSVVTTLQDQTEGKRLEEEREELRARLFRYDRLATVGTLAAGVGHEINNPLNVVSASLHYLDDELAAESGLPGVESARLRDSVTEAQAASKRIAGIVAGLRSYSDEDSQVRELTICDCIGLARRMTRNELSQVADLRVDVPPKLSVYADESRLVQVLINLIVNAAASFSNREKSHNHILLRAYPKEGGQVTIEVKDNGSGIPQEIQASIFDPFFSTRNGSQSGGIGLSVSKSILSQMGGQIEFESVEGSGSSFRIHLPNGSPSEVVPSRISQVSRLKPKLLLIDDEPSACRALSRVFAKDFEVVSESVSNLALQRLSSGEEFDAIICDIVMPDLSGPELYDLAVRDNPDVGERFIFVTGGAIYPELEVFLARTERPVFNKPLDISALKQAIDDLFMLPLDVEPAPVTTAYGQKPQ